MIGIIGGWHWIFPFSVIIAAASLCTLLYAFLLLNKKPIPAASVVGFVAILLFGIAKITLDARVFSDNSISRFATAEKHVHIYGRIADLPRETERSVRFVVEADSISINGNTYSAVDGVLVSIRRDNASPALSRSLLYGRQVSLKGDLTPARTARNPGEFDLQRYLHMNNVFAVLYVESEDSVNLGEEAKGDLLAQLVHPVRRSIAERIDRLIGGDEAKFLKGLVIGERSEIPLEVKNAFINAGVMHILAVSGLHVAIVTMILLVLFQILRIPEKLRIVIICLLLVYYIFLTGSAASVVRSVIMAIVFLCAKLIERRSDMYNVLAVSAIVILLYDSKQLFQPGFQLSYAAVFSIVALYPKITSLTNHLPQRVKENRMVSATIALIAVSVSAGIGTLPFTSIYFGKISIISFLANLVIVPLSNVILGLGMLTVGLSYASTWLASMYAIVTSVLTDLLLRLVDVLGNLPFSYVSSHFSIWSSLAFYSAVAVAINLEKANVRKYSFMGLVIGANIFLFTSLLFSSNRSLRVKIGRAHV